MGPPRGDSDKKTAEGLGDGSRFFFSGEADSLRIERCAARGSAGADAPADPPRADATTRGACTSMPRDGKRSPRGAEAPNGGGRRGERERGGDAECCGL